MSFFTACEALDSSLCDDSTPWLVEADLTVRMLPLLYGGEMKTDINVERHILYTIWMECVRHYIEKSVNRKTCWRMIGSERYATTGSRPANGESAGRHLSLE